jgi:hypothetical protein
MPIATSTMTDLRLEIQPQPDDYTCGPTCLHALYRYYGDEMPLAQIVSETGVVENGGTLAVLLACHALRRGYKATIYTYNLQVYDPSWFAEAGTDISAKLAKQLRAKPGQPKLKIATRAYREFLKRGGELRFEDLSPELIARHVTTGRPVLTGLSSTYLYRAKRERGENLDDDDIGGEPQGHFVVVCGFNRRTNEAMVADPLFPNPPFHSLKYMIGADRLINAILIGILTYDANLLIIEPASRRSRGAGRQTKAGAAARKRRA